PERRKTRIVRRIAKQNILSRVLTVPPLNVEGQITDHNGEPLIGVNVQVKGTNKGTASDYNGHLILNDVNENAILVISYIGYEAQEVPVEGRSKVDVVMVVDAELLGGGVVVVYRTQYNTTVTGSIKTMKAAKITAVPVPNITHTIAGKLAEVSTRLNRDQTGYDEPV